MAPASYADLSADLHAMILDHCDIPTFWNLIDLKFGYVSRASLRRLQRLFQANNCFVFATREQFRAWREIHYFRPLEEDQRDRPPRVYPHDDPLCHALSLDRADRVQIMLDNGLPPNCWTKTGWSSFSVAIWYGADRCFDLLFDALPGYDISRLDPCILPRPAFTMTVAAEQWKEHAFEKMLDRIEELNKTVPPISPEGIWEVIASFEAPVIDRAARLGLLLTNCSGYIHDEGPYHAAARHPNSLAVVAILDRACPWRLFQHDRYMCSPLWQAIDLRKPDLVQAYIDRGINVKHTNTDGETALHHCCRRHPIDLRILRILLNYIPVDISGNTSAGPALNVLIQTSYGRMYNHNRLVETRAPDGTLLATHGRPRRMNYAERRIGQAAAQACRIIVERSPNLNLTDEQGWTAWQRAKEFRQKTIMSILRNMPDPMKPDMHWGYRLRTRRR
ncbi:hypothetical protein BBP40_000597 [Aspergillus hancockii]|nr:hypothetical protein BBP40_000597 [Aspergillus hancockii]